MTGGSNSLKTCVELIDHASTNARLIHTNAVINIYPSCQIIPEQDHTFEKHFHGMPNRSTCNGAYVVEVIHRDVWYAIGGNQRTLAAPASQEIMYGVILRKDLNAVASANGLIEPGTQAKLSKEILHHLHNAIWSLEVGERVESLKDQCTQFRKSTELHFGPILILACNMKTYFRKVWKRNITREKRCKTMLSHNGAVPEGDAIGGDSVLASAYNRNLPWSRGRNIFAGLKFIYNNPDFEAVLGQFKLEVKDNERILASIGDLTDSQLYEWKEKVMAVSTKDRCSSSVFQNIRRNKKKYEPAELDPNDPFVSILANVAKTKINSTTTLLKKLVDPLKEEIRNLKEKNKLHGLAIPQSQGSQTPDSRQS